MLYYSTNKRAPRVNFREAVLNGLAPDGGLYLPVELPPLSHAALAANEDLTFPERAAEIARPFVAGEVDDQALDRLCAAAFDFPLPLVSLGEGVHALELFWGPTFAFKDFGARFLARVVNHFAAAGDRRLTILVATSGDTGSAVAHGFFGLAAVEVVLLYPSGRVSRLQEQQLTTLGGNVTALEVAGTFDDCQDMVKAAFADPEIRRRRRLNSANSINIGRLLPQSFYYVQAWARLGRPAGPFYVCAPSGNFGNLTGALLAKRMGLPITRLVAATNENDAVPKYLAGAAFAAQPVIRTPANAMDVGNPSNFARLLELCGGERAQMAAKIAAEVITTPDMLATIAACYRGQKYLLDPHGAVGYAGLRRFLEHSGAPGATALFAATAHPGKFREAVEQATGATVELPPVLAAALAKEKHALPLGNRPAHLREWLLDSAAAS